MSSGATASVRMPASFCTVWRGRMLTPAAIMIACLIVSMLSNSITTFTRMPRCRSARSIARRIVSSRSKATKASPCSAPAGTTRRRASRWLGWQTKAIGSARRGRTDSPRSGRG